MMCSRLCIFVVIQSTIQMKEVRFCSYTVESENQEHPSTDREVSICTHTIPTDLRCQIADSSGKIPVQGGASSHSGLRNRTNGYFSSLNTHIALSTQFACGSAWVR
jgi:hypothetical protein